MLGAKLWDFYTGIAEVDGFLLNPTDFVPEYQCCGFSRNGTEILQKNAVVCLFDSIYAISHLSELFQSLRRIFKVFPYHGVFGTEGGLVDLRVGWGG